MAVIDAQLHAWVPDSEAFPWHADSVSRIAPAMVDKYAAKSVSAEQLIWMMDAVGIDAALLMSPTIYGDDHRYSLAAALNYPGRFGVIGPLYPKTLNLENRVQRFRDQPWAVGIRVIIMSSPGPGGSVDAYRPLFAAAESHSVPVFLHTPGMLRSVQTIARDYPGLQIVLDHLGLSWGDSSAERLSMLPDLLALAPFENVALKCTAAPSLSTEAYPFIDLWTFISKIVSAFGIERVMWGTDITHHLGAVTYCEAVDYIRRSDFISDDDKELVLGGNADRILRLDELDIRRK